MQFIKMKGNHQVSYKSGWLTKGSIYSVTSIEGEDTTAKRLVEVGLAVEVQNPKGVSRVIAPKTFKDIIARQEELQVIQKDNIVEAKKEAKARRLKKIEADPTLSYVIDIIEEEQGAEA